MQTTINGRTYTITISNPGDCEPARDGETILFVDGPDCCGAVGVFLESGHVDADAGIDADDTDEVYAACLAIARNAHNL